MSGKHEMHDLDRKISQMEGIAEQDHLPEKLRHRARTAAKIDRAIQRHLKR